MKASMVKLAVYLPKEMLAEVQRESERLELPFSWVVRASWKMARRMVQAAPKDAA